jgi:chromosome segregation ATPase
MAQTPNKLYPIEEEITPLEHQILLAGGSSSKLERLPSRLKQWKDQRSTSLREEIEELAYENSYLKAELAWNQEARRALMEFHEKTFEAATMIRESLIEVNHRLRESEDRYLELWGVPPEQRRSEMGV